MVGPERPQGGVQAWLLENHELSGNGWVQPHCPVLALRAQVALMALFWMAHPVTSHSILMALFLPDLSFNNIDTIEGLDTLVNLEDLSLFNNSISKIESLDALEKLQVLSLGNNQIGNMTDVSSRSRQGWGGSGRRGRAMEVGQGLGVRVCGKVRCRLSLL